MVELSLITKKYSISYRNKIYILNQIESVDYGEFDYEISQINLCGLKKVLPEGKEKESIIKYFIKNKTE